MRRSYIPPIGSQPLASSGPAQTRPCARSAAIAVLAARATAKTLLAIFTVTAPDIYIYISFLYGAYIQGTGAVTVGHGQHLQHERRPVHGRSAATRPVKLS